jgi:hypothetical protein
MLFVAAKEADVVVVVKNLLLTAILISLAIFFNLLYFLQNIFIIFSMQNLYDLFLY